MSKWIAGTIILMATLAGIYAVAATIATSAASGISATESARRTGLVELAVAIRRAANEQRTANAKCEQLTRGARVICHAEANAEHKRASAQARTNYNGTDRARARPAMKDIAPKGPRGLDLALYRAHRQWDEDSTGCIGFGATEDGFRAPTLPVRIAMH
jgi:hypothetical protein